MKMTGRRKEIYTYCSCIGLVEHHHITINERDWEKLECRRSVKCWKDGI